MVMESSTLTLLIVLLIIGAFVTLFYMYLSVYNIMFFKEAIVIWVIVVIAVFGAFIFEVYDSAEK